MLLALLAATLSLSTSIPPAQDPEPKPAVTQDTVVTVRIERVDTWGRTVTFRSAEGLLQSIHVPKELSIFDELEQGDLVRIRYRDSFVVQVKPGASLAPPADTTAEARAAQTDPDADEIQQQMTATIRVDRIDRSRNLIVYTGQDKRPVMRAVRDPRLLDGLEPGDVVTVTYTRERAISVEHVKP